MSVYQILPSATADGSAVINPTRTDPYLGAIVQPQGAGNWSFAAEGSYIVGNNATLATAISGHAAPVVADGATKPLFAVYNGSTKTFYLDYLYLEVMAAGTGGTIHYTTVYLDNKGSTARTSGGTAITPVCSNNASSVPSGLEIYFGAVVQSMTSAAKVGQQLVREVIPVVQDTVTMKFGGPNAGEHSALTTAGTATNHCVQHFAPVAIRPGGNLNISQIRASQSAACDYQFSFGAWVR